MASHVPAARYASPATPTLLSAVAEDRLRAVVREAAAQAGFDRRYEAPEVVAALEAATSLRPDLCVLDLTLVDDLSGTLELLVSCSPRTSVVVMAPNGDGTGVLAAFSSGARGYATADIASASLARVFADVLAGRVSVPRELVGLLLDEVMADEARAPGGEC